jgi:hypothetical protein
MRSCVRRPLAGMSWSDGETEERRSQLTSAWKSGIEKTRREEV